LDNGRLPAGERDEPIQHSGVGADHYIPAGGSGEIPCVNQEFE
jgi:hypothetical protein